MKIKKQKRISGRTRKIVLIIASLVLVSILTYAGLIATGKLNNPFASTGDAPGSKSDQPATPEDNIAPTEKSPAEDTPATTVDPSKPGTTPDPGARSSIKVVLTQKSQEAAGSEVRIRALIEGSTTGTCTLTLTQGNQKIVRQAPYVAQANYVICQGFNLAASEFTANGSWELSLSVVDMAGNNGQTNDKIEVTR